MISLDWILLGLRIISAILLYTFLGVAFYLIWQSLKQAETQTTQPQPEFQLRVVASSDEQLLKVGDSVSLQAMIWLGCEINNQVTLREEPDSQHQIRISQENGAWQLENFGSENNLVLNDRTLSNPATLAPGDTIGIGQVRFSVE